MGQRSQIYIRCKREDGTVALIARYYQWNYGERMISRARWSIEAMLEKMSDYYWEHRELELTKRYLDVNFDMHSIVMGSDIIDEFKEYGEGESFNDYVFYNQDNNDGKLLIDVDIKNQKIKYAFLDSGTSLVYIMDGEGYMTWNACYGHENGDDWRKILADNDKEAVATCEENIKCISEMAELMTRDEVSDFLSYEYVV